MWGTIRKLPLTQAHTLPIVSRAVARPPFLLFFRGWPCGPAEQLPVRRDRTGAVFMAERDSGVRCL